jgi:UTP--glucose-1-phosphate uridylyltransferase
MSSGGLRAAEEKMRAHGQHEEAIRAFRSAYERLVAGESAYVASADLDPAGDVESLGQLPDADPAAALADVVVVKLNGGLATTMGLRAPKSLVEARDGRSFLDIIVGQIRALRGRHGIRLPLVLMDSEATHEQTLEALPSDASGGMEPDFMQSVVPKLAAEGLDPMSWPPTLGHAADLARPWVPVRDDF